MVHDYFYTFNLIMFVGPELGVVDSHTAITMFQPSQYDSPSRGFIQKCS